MDIPGFKIDREIGQGGMATVYLAVQESLGRQVVLKVMNTLVGDSPEFAKRFINEGHLLASVSHPNIITIFDIGIADDSLYISMEYLGGGDLVAKLKDGPLTQEEALDILYKIGSALVAAHNRGMVHRDVKPANILFSNDGTPILTDFGIAKQLGDTELTSTGTILGSPFYMSPEQIEGKLVLDGRSDIYSLGIILYEMVIGHRPYEGETAINIVLQHLQSPLPKLPKQFSACQPLLNLMLAKNRDERVPDASALLERITATRYPGSQERSKQRQSELKPERQAPKAYSHGEITQHLINVRKRRIRNWAVLITGVLLVAGVLSWYFASEIRRYDNISSLSERPGRTASHGAVAGPAGTLATAGEPGAGTATRPKFQREVITALKWLARKSLEEGRLTAPPEDNAYYYFNRLLELDPGNQPAQNGINDVARRFAELADTQIRKKNFKKAEAFIAEGLTIDPENKQLQVLRSSIQLREKTLLDSLKELLTGQG